MRSRTEMRKIELPARDGHAAAVLTETGDPGTWSAAGTGWGRPNALLNRAVELALQNGADRLLFPGMTASDPDYPFRMSWHCTKEEDGDTVLELVVPDRDGEVHDDYDRRMPVSRITCSTCLTRIAEGRVIDRAEAMEHGGEHRARSAAQHARRIAEAYQRLAEIEELIASEWESQNPGQESPPDP